MYIDACIPGTRIRFEYDFFDYDAHFVRERNLGHARLEDRRAGQTTAIIRRLDSEALPEDLSKSFERDREQLSRQHGSIRRVAHEGDVDFERATWEGERSAGARWITRRPHGSAWMIALVSRRKSAAELEAAATALHQSVGELERAPSGQESLAVSVYGSLRRIEDMKQSAIIDVLIGPASTDVHVGVLRLTPNCDQPRNQVVFQHQQLRLFSRVLTGEDRLWRSLAVPQDGYLLVQLPRVYFASAPASSRGEVSVHGLSSGGASVQATCSMEALDAEIALQWPVPSSWRVLNGPDELSIHRLAATVRSGTLYVAQRGAMDFSFKTAPQDAPEGSPLSPEEELRRHGSFGEPVRSPCAGTVTRVENSVEDQPIGLRNRKRSRGNEICIRRDDDLYVVLAHLRKGSVRVSAGERVAAGQHLADVGNTGRSSEPHLHMHVADSQEKLAHGVTYYLPPKEQSPAKEGAAPDMR